MGNNGKGGKPHYRYALWPWMSTLPLLLYMSWSGALCLGKGDEYKETGTEIRNMEALF